MKSRFVTTVLFIVALAFAADYAQAKVTKKQLVGTWSVVAVTNEVDGKKIDLYGPNPQGQFIFTREGHFSFEYIRPGRHKFASGNRTTGTPEENKEAMAGSLGMFGTYMANSDGSITLHITGSSFPNWDGTEQKRRAEINGDEMKWINPTASTGSGTAITILRRVK
jgi:hypothetical protein